MSQITAAFSKPAAHRRAVVFCCDAGYLPFALHAATQIAGLQRDRQFDICIVTMDDLTIPDSLTAHGLRLIKVTTDGAFADLPRDARRSESVYLRLALPHVLTADYDRLLYLDSDIHVDGGDFNALMHLDLGGRAIGAVRDTMQWRTPQRASRDFTAIHLPPAPYFNSGVLLLDLIQWAKADLSARILDLAGRHPDAIRQHDQTLLNWAAHCDWAELSPLWNWQMTKSARLFGAMAPVNIAHFIGPAKPWRDKAQELPPRYARDLARFMAMHFPDHPPIPMSQMPARNTPLMRKMFLRNTLAAARMARYLDRFPTDMTVR
ncbi:hypothetical protein AN189_01575 [Loktanella sp. 3ANDIMAR09]|uniref:glycosyltransferase family 8 protein n=1 Tax=Loktanella sp. 3ANDIMAR09 TaxID=1225657 RepID=UPI00070846D4|nr:glycosyltransferase family 8 protein [Loktanella sp. 3ANDIMAR09]KQI70113.1 hypothetical protein AN189_01575 [Loktanella sp. 3ANDIMAR09]